MANIKDIAKRVNVSISTVSYALNGGPRNVPAPVKEKIFAAARELNYRPNRLAKSLITRRSHVIGIVATKIEPHMAAGPYFVQMLNGIVNACEVLKHDVMLFTQLSSWDEEAVLFTLLDGRCDGIIFLAPTVESRVLKELGSTGLPHLVINGPEHEFTPAFRVDNRDGMSKAIDHLSNLGHKNIGLLAGPVELIDGQERNEGFRMAMERHGLKIREDWIQDAGFHPRTGRIASEAILSLPERPTAICCSNDETAFQLNQVAKSKGIRVPEDLSIIGFDNTHLSVISDPPLTTIAQPLVDIAYQATEELINAINNETRVPSRQFPTALVERCSTTRPTEDKNQ